MQLRRPSLLTTTKTESNTHILRMLQQILIFLRTAIQGSVLRKVVSGIFLRVRFSQPICETVGKRRSMSQFALGIRLCLFAVQCKDRYMVRPVVAHKNIFSIYFAERTIPFFPKTNSHWGGGGVPDEIRSLAVDKYKNTISRLGHGIFGTVFLGGVMCERKRDE